MRRGLDGFCFFWPACSFQASPGPRSRGISVAIARGKHLFPFRTEPLSPSAPMVLGGQPPGRVGRRRFLLTPKAATGRLSSYMACLRCVALEGGAEVGAGGTGARKAPFRRGLPATIGPDPRPTGAAAGRRQGLPTRPATGSRSPVGPLATGPVRAERLEAVLAQRGEVDHEIDAADHALAEVVAPVEHGAKVGAGSDGTYVLQWKLRERPSPCGRTRGSSRSDRRFGRARSPDFTGRACRSCGRPA